MDVRNEQSNDEEVKKFGLEVGLFKSVQGGQMDQAKALLKKYGSAYIATSVSLAVLSFTICYALVDSGVDVAEVLNKLGINVDSDSIEKTAGTATLAYVLHKATSPIRTIPVVALTPVVAEWIGKKEEDTTESS